MAQKNLILLFFSFSIFTLISCKEEKKYHSNIIYKDQDIRISFHTLDGKDFILKDKTNHVFFLTSDSLNYSVYGPSINPLGIESYRNTFHVEITPTDSILKDNKLPIIISFKKNGFIKKIHYGIKVK